jgi:uncharacterized protein (TIGR00299 family) protein
LKTLYLDCASGISGDMTVAALLDLGASAENLLAALETLGVPGWKASAKKAMKGPLAGTSFKVEVDESASGGDRSLPQIQALIRSSGLTQAVKERALQAFHHLAVAEAAVHGTTLDHVHFHEVGAADSIVDIVGAAFALEELDPEEIVCSPIALSRGHVKCRHGLIPLPAPAVLELARGLPICRPPAPIFKELATPTGLALAKTFATSFGEIPEGRLLATGTGLGHANFPWPNVLRALLIESSAASRKDQVLLLEANLDDMSPEAMAHALERLLDEGALDAWLVPIHMKKGRPGFIFSVLCEPGAGDRLSGQILRETRTLGLRRRILDRAILDRETLTVETRFGPARCKVARLEGLPPRVKPEFEDCRRLAHENHEPLFVIEQEVLQKAQQALDSSSRA